MIRVMPKSKTVGKVAISLPADLLRDLDRIRRETRSAVICRSVELLVSRPDEARMVREYVAGYLTHPEGRTEVDAAMATAGEAITDGSWERHAPGRSPRRTSRRSIGR